MTLSLQSPGEGENNVALDVEIYVRQEYGGQSANKVDATITIDGGAPIDVLVLGSWQAGYSGTLTDVAADTVDITIVPDNPLPANATIVCTYELEDTLTFYTGDGSPADPTPLCLYGEP